MAFIPADFLLPAPPAAERWCMRPLHPDDVEMDYAAVMSSRERLRQVFAEHDQWPRDDMTLEQDRGDLVAHYQEYEQRESFAWMVTNITGDQCLGCVYLYPASMPDYDVEIYLWVTDTALATGLDDELEITIKQWLAECWPFTRPAWPGRDIPWHDWHGKSRFAEDDRFI